jgi:hypothetical protein
MRKVLWSLLGVAFLIAVAGFFYSVDSAVYECSGTVTKDKTNYAGQTVFIKVTTKRWWAFWTTSATPWDGLLLLEAQSPDADPANVIKILNFDIKRNGSYLFLYRSKAGETVDMTKPGQGYFSTISNYLTLKLYEEATFNGSCKPK